MAVIRALYNIGWQAYTHSTSTGRTPITPGSMTTSGASPATANFTNRGTCPIHYHERQAAVTTTCVQMPRWNIMREPSECKSAGNMVAGYRDGSSDSGCTPQSTIGERGSNSGCCSGTFYSSVLQTGLFISWFSSRTYYLINIFKCLL